MMMVGARREREGCVDLKHSAFLAQLLLEEVDLESTSEPAPPVLFSCWEASAIHAAYAHR